MVGWWSPDDVNKDEGILLYDDFDPLKEWLVDPDRAQMQNTNDFSASGLDAGEIHSTGNEFDLKHQSLGPSIDEKMEKVSLVEVSMGGQGGGGGFEENGVELKTSPAVIEELKIDGLKKNGSFLEGSDDSERVFKKNGEELKACGPKKNESFQEDSDDSEMVFQKNGEELKASPVEMEEIKIELKKNESCEEVSDDSERVFQKNGEELKASPAEMGEIKVDGVKKNVSCQEDSDDTERVFRKNGEELKASPVEVMEIKIDGLKKNQSCQEDSDDSGMAFKKNGEEWNASLAEIVGININGLKKNGSCQGDNDDSGREFNKELKASPAEMEEMKINGLKKNESCQEISDDEKESGSEVADSESGESSSDDSTSSESSSGATSSSSSEEEEVFAVKRRDRAKELEEGEVRDSEAEAAAFLSDEEEEGAKGPISSKHEILDLPPVAKVVASLEPYHQMLPVGVISSIMSNRVIVDGSISHNPLDEGSILWVAHTRTPLGIVDEVFGPVKSPYYVIRYNYEEELPEEASVGAAISFVMEFASHILNNKELYRKGYDASADNDEEIDDEVEFSDDEKEAEYKRSLRQVKRAGIGDGKPMKQEVRFDKERTSSKAPRIQCMEIQTHAPSSMDQSCLKDLAPPRPAPLFRQGGFGMESCKSMSGAATDLCTLPTLPAFPLPLQSVNLFGNLSQPLLTHQLDAFLAPGFSPQLQNTAWQNNLPMQLQNQNLLFNNFVNLIAFQQQLQQLIPNQESSMPWLSTGSSLQPVGAASSQQPMGHNNFATSPFINGMMNVPGTPDLGNDQRQGQFLPSFVPSLQFNEGPSGSSQGRRPYQRGGGRSRFFRHGGQQNNHR